MVRQEDQEDQEDQEIRERKTREACNSQVKARMINKEDNQVYQINQSRE